MAVASSSPTGAGGGADGQSERATSGGWVAIVGGGAVLGTLGATGGWDRAMTGGCGGVAGCGGGGGGAACAIRWGSAPNPASGGGGEYAGAGGGEYAGGGGAYAAGAGATPTGRGAAARVCRRSRSFSRRAILSFAIAVVMRDPLGCCRALRRSSFPSRRGHEPCPPSSSSQRRSASRLCLFQAKPSRHRARS